MPPKTKKKVKQIKRRVEIIDGVEVPLRSKRKPKPKGATEETVVFSKFVDQAIRENEKRVAAEKTRKVKPFTRLDEIKQDLEIHRSRIAELRKTPKQQMALIDTYVRIITSIEAEEKELLSKKKK